ncbi:hemolysin XhlA family protein [Clostridium rectalis]|uniref:hemolysin XhlA family protein n=1 Tax=Clostridium rectalis TaxID=2040295 RepID=UPI000F63BDC4|nr:hemolysin XhlA family protein [Clostridium rectalis]
MKSEVMEMKINEHTDTLKEHDKRLDKIEQDGREFRIEIKNLCENIKGLTSAIKWLIGLGASGLLGFFFYMVQYGLLK